MPTLVSPGVSISVIDESINVGAGPGTVPLIFIATQQDKLQPDGLTLAQGTTKANANRIYSITSQRELVSTFGDPKFYSVSGTSLNGYPLNEYGLLAAYSYLGIANLTRIVRVDIDTAQLEPSSIEPSSPAAAGTLWFDETASTFGLFQRSGTFPNETWVPVSISQIFNNTVSTHTTAGSASIVFNSTTSTIAYSIGTGSTVSQIGTTSYTGTAASSSSTTVTINNTAGLMPGMIPVVSTGTGAFAANTVVVNVLSSTQFTVSQAPTTPLSAATVTAGFGVVVQSVWPDLTSSSNVAEYWIKTSEAAQGAKIVLRKMGATSGVFELLTSPILADDSAANTYYSTDPDGSEGQVYVKPIQSGTGGFTINSFEFRIGTGETGPWVPLTGITGSVSVPVQGPAVGQLWYNAELGLDGNGQSTIDMLWADGEGHWQNVKLPGFSTQVTLPSAPTLYTQSSDPRDNVPAPVLTQGDIWVDTNVNPYPVIYRWNGSSWIKINNSDQVTPNGIIFKDARPNPLYHRTTGDGENNGGGAGNPDLDPDAPDSDLYPKGFLLWNTRYSTANVKQWNNPFVANGVQAQPDDTNDGSVGRWVNYSGNNPGGVPFMGQAAQNICIVKAIQEAINSNEDLRAEDLYFNLIAAPGYVEAVDEMLVLNTDRKETAFVLCDTPFTLAATGTQLDNWAKGTNPNAYTNGADGLKQSSKYFAAWYPSGLSSNVDGVDVVVPPTHMALRTIAYNDQVAYPWFAPAGLQRGIVNNAANVGYVNETGQFVQVKLSEGQRDVLYSNGINPIRVMPNGGIVVFGQKTRQPYASATDRINVVRLENYLRYQLNQLAMPFLFEPNDSITRKAVKDSFDRFLSELITLRALYDFLVVCDLSNNTPARIDRNELWIDIAIQPVKAIEFIYIPIRIKNTGASLTA